MKTRTLNLVAIQAVLAIGLLQALPSRADTNPTPPSGTIAPQYISPGLASIWAWVFG